MEIMAITGIRQRVGSQLWSRPRLIAYLLLVEPSKRFFSSILGCTDCALQFM